MKPSIYVAGGMRTIPLFNTPLFDLVAESLQTDELVVVNPAQLDRERGFDVYELPENHDWNEFPSVLDLEDTIREDLDHVLKCDAIILLPGWQKSTGANAEAATARWAGKQMFDWPEFEYLEQDNLCEARQGEYSVKGIRPDALTSEEMQMRFKQQLAEQNADTIRASLLVAYKASQNIQIEDSGETVTNTPQPQVG